MHMLEFEGAKLKKIKLTPFIDRQAEVKCQVRVNPTGNLEQLGHIRITEACVVAFTGAGIEKGKNKDQTELEV